MKLNLFKSKARRVERGEIYISAHNYSVKDGKKAANHNVIIFDAMEGEPVAETVLITHKKDKANEPFNLKKLKSKGWRPDKSSQVTSDKFYSVKESLIRKEANYEI